MSEQVTTAVILARGLGTRMRAPDPSAALSAEQAGAASIGYKALMPIGAHRLVDYGMSALAAAGIERIVLVVGPEHDDFRSHIDSLPLERITVDLAVQEKPEGTADAVLSTAEILGEEPFLVVNGDNLYPVDSLHDLAVHGGNALLGFDRAALVAGSNIPAERIAAFALIDVVSGRLAEIVEKPAPAVVETRGAHALISMNAFAFTREVFDACRRIAPSARGEFEIVDAVRILRDSADGVAVLPTAGAVLDLSRREDIGGITALLAGAEVTL